MAKNIQLTGKNEIKIFILFLMESVGYPLNSTEINEISVSDDVIGGFDFAECFSELISAGHVIGIEEDGETKYSVSDTGHTVAVHLQSKIHTDIRQQSVKTALRYFDIKKMKATLDFECEQRDDGLYDVTLILNEKGKEKMRIKLAVASIEFARKMKDTFYDHPDAIYRGLLSFVSGEVDYLFSC